MGKSCFLYVYKQRAGEGWQKHFHWFFKGLKQTWVITMFSRRPFWEKYKAVFSNDLERRSELIDHWRLRAGTRQQKQYFV